MCCLRGHAFEFTQFVGFSPEGQVLFTNRREWLAGLVEAGVIQVNAGVVEVEVQEFVNVPLCKKLVEGDYIIYYKDGVRVVSEDVFNREYYSF